MITYNPKDWFRLTLQFHRSDTFAALLPTMVLLGLFSGLLVYVERRYGVLLESSTVFHQILGFVLSMLLVFRINTAYERWWEGRRLWGTLVNNSRSLAVKFVAMLNENHTGELRAILGLLSVFPRALCDHLRDAPSNDLLIPNNPSDTPILAGQSHKPLTVYQLLVKRVEALRSTGALSTEQLILLNSELTSLVDVLGACERIKHSPIPFSYSLFLKKTIFLYVTTMPFPFSVAFGYWSIPAVPIFLYVFASIELVSEEVEEPFGLDENDLPLDELVEKIRLNVEAIGANLGHAPFNHP